MYSITEIILIQLLCIIIGLNSVSAINYLKRCFPFFHKNMNEFIKFYNFICENNPLLLDYYDDIKDDDVKDDITIQPRIQIKYEDKYLEKFKTFPNEFVFDELELKQEADEYEKIKINLEKQKTDDINNIKDDLFKLNDICQKVGDGNKYIDNDDNKMLLIKFNQLDVEDDDLNECIHANELYEDIIKKKNILEYHLYNLENNVVTDDELRLKAHAIIVKNKLDRYMDNYVLEHTPLGVVVMRYNSDKNSFEYYSNNTIPYRYLEPIGRRYVMTYWCKPLFVDIEEELKRAEERYDREKKIKEEDEKRKQDEIKTKPKDIIARMKSYNKDTKSQTIMNQPTKNRSSNYVLPPQIKMNLPNVNQFSEKQLLKENANRYTWEGRLTGFCPLKKIDKKLLDKKLAMSYAEFKKMQQEEKNKK